MALVVTPGSGAGDESGFSHVISVLVFCKNVARTILIMQTLDRKDAINTSSSKIHE